MISKVKKNQNFIHNLLSLNRKRTAVCRFFFFFSHGKQCDENISKIIYKENRPESQGCQAKFTFY